MRNPLRASWPLVALVFWVFTDVDVAAQVAPHRTSSKLSAPLKPRQPAHVPSGRVRSIPLDEDILKIRGAKGVLVNGEAGDGGPPAAEGPKEQKKSQLLPQSAWSEVGDLGHDRAMIMGGDEVANGGQGGIGGVGTVHRSDPRHPSENTAKLPEPQSVMAAIAVSEEQPEDKDALSDVVAVGNESHFQCTGILIAANAVLTARHCLPVTNVAFGETVADPIVSIRITRSVPASGTTDLAVLWLAHTSTITIRRWHEMSDGQPAPLGKIAGFGAVDSREHASGKKRAARIPLQGWGCDLSRGRTTGCEADHELVVAVPGGIDTCDGDSGGPLFERVGSEWRLLGITSRPLASSRRRCGDGGVYTRVDKEAAWIREVLVAGPGKSVNGIQ